MKRSREDKLFGAAVLKLSFAMNGKMDTPQFRIVYFGTLKEFELTDAEVTKYLMANKQRLTEHIERHRSRGDSK